VDTKLLNDRVLPLMGPAQLNVGQPLVNNGLLDAGAFLPAIRNGWKGLIWAQQEDGRLGWVQQIGYDPRLVTANDSMEYGTGAFLLAGSEMLKLTESAD